MNYLDIAIQRNGVFTKCAISELAHFRTLGLSVEQPWKYVDGVATLPFLSPKNDEYNPFILLFLLADLDHFYLFEPNPETREKIRRI